jgi:hypothetical protein
LKPCLPVRRQGAVKTATTCRFLLEAPPQSDVGRSGTGHGQTKVLNLKARTRPEYTERNSKVSLGNFTMSMLGKATSWNARAFITPPIYLGPDDNTSSLETREQVDQLLRTCEHRISGWQSSGPARVMLYRYISIRGRYDTAGFSLPTLGPGEQKPLIAASETIAVSDHTKSVLRGTAQRMTLVP